MPGLFLFIFALFLAAAFMNLDFIFYILYIFFGIYLLGKLWTRQALRAVRYRRGLPTDHAFLGEVLDTELEVVNTSWPPLPWLYVRDNLPVQLHVPSSFHRVISLSSHERAKFIYQLHCRRRGYYRLGPLFLRTGDLFGVAQEAQQWDETQSVTVYPKIIPLRDIPLPSQSPFGELPSRQHVFEDPTRVIGVRDYTSSDSLRHINWKVSANVGRLQVKKYEPAISLETVLFLNLNSEEYNIRSVVDASELAIIITASVANHLAEKRQKVGLVTNGVDPLGGDARATTLPPRKGQGHLMKVLEILARVEVGRTISFTELLRRQSVLLSWGTTAIVITPQDTEDLFTSLLQLRRRGFHMVLILVDMGADFSQTRRRAAQIGVPAYHVWRESDLDMWR
jgi:uncharacterized protein (DUF58 family)